jgi:hypothetical protein
VVFSHWAVHHIDMHTNGLGWLNDLRKLAENTNNPHC